MSGVPSPPQCTHFFRADCFIVSAKDAPRAIGASLSSPCVGLQRCRPPSGGTIHRRPAAAARWLRRPGRWSMLAIESGAHHTKPLVQASATTACSQTRTSRQCQRAQLVPARSSGRPRAQGRRRRGRNPVLLRPRQMQPSVLLFSGLLAVRGLARPWGPTMTISPLLSGTLRA